MKRAKKVHFAGADPFKQGSNFRFLGCANPNSELAISTHKDNDIITTDPAKVTCCHCRMRLPPPLDTVREG